MSEDKDWSVDDRVQRIKEDDTIVGGTVTAVATETQERTDYWSRKKITETYVSQLTVKWDTGEEETVSPSDIDPEDSELERQFRALVPSATDRINAELDLAYKHLEAAVKISEETGVPFNSGISFLSQSYVPVSFEKKFADVSDEVVSSLCEVYSEYAGWEHSAVC